MPESYQHINTLPKRMVIDNPGIREIAFWEGEQGIEAAFPP
jgi:putative ribosome biogenesis GTPase RsgA